MSNSDFLSFLVDETFKLQKNGEVELSSFERKLTDYGLSFLRGEFIPFTQMLRFQTHFGIIDIPINWSIFSNEKHPDEHTILDVDKNVDHLFTVLRKSWDPSMEKILMTHADGFCYLVGLRAGDDAHLHDLLNPQEWLKVA